MKSVSRFTFGRAVALGSAMLLIIGMSCGLVAYGQEGQEDEQDTSGITSPDEATATSLDTLGLTPKMLEDLRAKLPNYRDDTDQEIVLRIQRMGPNYDAYISDKSVVGEIGVLAVAHGFREVGDTEFKDSFRSTGKLFPTSVAFGMALHTSSHIQSAVDDIVAAGAKTIVVIPATTTENGGLMQQWKYIFGLSEDSAFMEVPPVKTEANILMVRPPSSGPIITAIMLDYALEMSDDPQNEVVILVAHGASTQEKDRKELTILSDHAEIIRQDSDFSEVKVITLQDTAPEDIHAAKVEKFRSWVEAASKQGKRALIVSTALVTSRSLNEIKRHLTGLEYGFSGKGLMVHPLFEDWIGYAVRDELKRS